ncbi:MAG: 50S ribosomal protein L11 methyltransferase [Gammaproteobacteria bacterium]
MPWLRLRIDTNKDKIGLVTGLFEQFGAASISYRPASGETLFAGSAENSIFWQRTAVIALLDPEIDMDILLACLRNRIGTANILAHKIDVLEEREWTEAHKQGYGTMLFGGRLCVCPGWLDPPPDYPCSITLDPGLAFGTGTHATTALCLDWLAGHELYDKTVIDYGCGSGILALAAARLGARHVYAVDTDPQAITAASANAGRNNLVEKITITAPQQLTLSDADILVANILLDPLLTLAPEFSRRVQAGGEIALSGILASQAQECLSVYGRWFTMQETEFHDEWALIKGHRSTE